MCPSSPCWPHFGHTHPTGNLSVHRTMPSPLSYTGQGQTLVTMLPYPLWVFLICLCSYLVAELNWLTPIATKISEGVIMSLPAQTRCPVSVCGICQMDVRSGECYQAFHDIYIWRNNLSNIFVDASDNMMFRAFF